MEMRKIHKVLHLCWKQYSIYNRNVNLLLLSGIFLIVKCLNIRNSIENNAVKTTIDKLKSFCVLLPKLYVDVIINGLIK